jgi:predicted Zn-dependent protease with MMP-like domain
LPEQDQPLPLAARGRLRRPAELAEQVRRTVIHELAHHAGIDDERLERYGLD